MHVSPTLLRDTQRTALYAYLMTNLLHGRPRAFYMSFMIVILLQNIGVWLNKSFFQKLTTVMRMRKKYFGF